MNQNFSCSPSPALYHGPQHGLRPFFVRPVQGMYLIMAGTAHRNQVARRKEQAAVVRSRDDVVDRLCIFNSAAPVQRPLIYSAIPCHDGRTKITPPLSMIQLIDSLRLPVLPPAVWAGRAGWDSLPTSGATLVDHGDHLLSRQQNSTRHARRCRKETIKNCMFCLTITL